MNLENPVRLNIVQGDGVGDLEAYDEDVCLGVGQGSDRVIAGGPTGVPHGEHHHLPPNIFGGEKFVKPGWFVDTRYCVRYEPGYQGCFPTFFIPHHNHSHLSLVRHDEQE